ncbi:MAG: hypothetical protein QM765_33070 [Myxococcales bacterium]
MSTNHLMASAMVSSSGRQLYPSSFSALVWRMSLWLVDSVVSDSKVKSGRLPVTPAHAVANGTPTLASQMGDLSEGTFTPVSLPTRCARSENGRHLPPKRYFSPLRPFSAAAMAPLAMSRTSTQSKPASGSIGRLLRATIRMAPPIAEGLKSMGPRTAVGLTMTASRPLFRYSRITCSPRALLAS